MGLDSTGIFAVATYMAVLVSVPNRSVSAISAPQLSRAIKENNRDECSHLMGQVTRNMLLIGGFILLAIWINIDLIFHILPNGATFAAAKDVVLILGISQLIVASFTICLTALNYSRFYAFSLLLSLILTISALLFNNYLVPILGMEGAALSNLFSYGLYYVLSIATVVPLCRFRIVDRNWWYTALLIIALFAVNYVWCHYAPATHIWLDSLLRSVVLLGSGALIAYKAQLSPEINNIVIDKLKIKN